MLRASVIVFPGSSEQFELDLGTRQAVVLGRDPAAAQVVFGPDDRHVSRRHASIRQRGTEYIVVDEKSTNGTLLNREPVIGEELLHDRDEIGPKMVARIARRTGLTSDDL